VKLFADDGLNVMTSIFFPTSTFNTMTVNDKLLNMKTFELKSTAIAF